jgi:hypothetical protein
LFSFQLKLLKVEAVLFVTGTINSWVRNFGTRLAEEGGNEATFWHMIAARLPPALEPPTAVFKRLRCRTEALWCSPRGGLPRRHGLRRGKDFLVPIYFVVNHIFIYLEGKLERGR